MYGRKKLCATLKSMAKQEQLCPALISAWWRIFSDMRGPAENEPDTNRAKNDSYLLQTESKSKLFDGVVPTFSN